MSSLPRYSFCEKQNKNTSTGPFPHPAAFLSTYERNLNAELNNISDPGSFTAQDQHLDYRGKRNKRQRSLLFTLAVAMTVVVVVVTAVVASLLAAKVNFAGKQQSPTEDTSTLPTSSQVVAVTATPTSTVSSLIPTTIATISTQTIFTEARPSDTNTSGSALETTTTTEDHSVTTTIRSSSEQTTSPTTSTSSVPGGSSSSGTTAHASSINLDGITIVPLEPTTIAGKSTLLPWTATHKLATTWLVQPDSSV